MDLCCADFYDPVNQTSIGNLYKRENGCSGRSYWPMITNYIKFFRYEVDLIKLKTQNFFNESSERKMVSERWFSNSVSSDAYYETTFYRIYCKVKCPAITHSVYLLANKYTRVRKQPTSLLRQTPRLPVWQNFKLEQYTARISCLACI